MDGQWSEGEACTEGTVCANGGCQECTPGQKICGGDAGNEIWSCPAEGALPELVESCVEGTQCYSGYCLNPCAPDIKEDTNVGCEYYAIDLENSDEQISGFTA